MAIAPHTDEFDEFVRTALVPWCDPDEPGMHRTATLDCDVVLEGTIGLQMDDGVEVGTAEVRFSTLHTALRNAPRFSVSRARS